MADQTPTPVTNNQITILHVVCVALIAALFGLSATVFKGNSEISAALVGAAMFLYGKLAFLPQTGILSYFLQRKTPQAVADIAQMPKPIKTAISIIEEKKVSIPPGAIADVQIPVTIVGAPKVPSEFSGEDKSG